MKESEGEGASQAALQQLGRHCQSRPGLGLGRNQSLVEREEGSLKSSGSGALV